MSTWARLSTARDGARIEWTQGDLLQVRRDPETKTVFIADRAEEELRKRHSRTGPIWTVGGLLVSAGALSLLLSWFVTPA